MRINYKTYKAELLKNPEIKKGYDKLKPEFDLIRVLIRKRIETGISQKELAKRVGTKQSAISRLESGSYNPTIGFLNKVVRAMGGTLRVSIQ